MHCFKVNKGALNRGMIQINTIGASKVIIIYSFSIIRSKILLFVVCCLFHAMLLVVLLAFHVTQVFSKLHFLKGCISFVILIVRTFLIVSFCGQISVRIFISSNKSW